MKSFTSDQPAAVLVPRNYLHACLLLLIAEEPAHGYELGERLAGLGLTGTDSGAVYRALRALNQDGLLESWWEESGPGPVRRRYRLSDAGAASLEAWAGTVGSSASYLNSFLTRHRRLHDTPFAASGAR